MDTAEDNNCEDVGDGGETEVEGDSGEGDGEERDSAPVLLSLMRLTSRPAGLVYMCLASQPARTCLHVSCLRPD